MNLDLLFNSFKGQWSQSDVQARRRRLHGSTAGDAAHCGRLALLLGSEACSPFQAVWMALYGNLFILNPLLDRLNH